MSRSPSAPLTLAGGLLLASVAPAVPFFTDPRPFSQVAGSAVHMSLYALTLAGMLALLVAVPRLRSLASPEGRRLPDGVLTTALLATALYAATQFVQVFVAADLADSAPAALDESGDLMMYGMLGSWLVFLVAWVALGVVGMKRRVLSRSSGVLLIVGAVAQPVIGPLAALPLGLGLLLVARGAGRPVSSPQAPASARV